MKGNTVQFHQIGKRWTNETGGACEGTRGINGSMRAGETYLGFSESRGGGFYVRRLTLTISEGQKKKKYLGTGEARISKENVRRGKGG